MSIYTLDDERFGWYYHQGCIINWNYCQLNRLYDGCKKCIKYKEKGV